MKSLMARSHLTLIQFKLICILSGKKVVHYGCIGWEYNTLDVT